MRAGGNVAMHGAASATLGRAKRYRGRQPSPKEARNETQRQEVTIVPSIRRLLWGMLLVAGAGAVHAAPQDALPLIRLAATSRTFVTLVPHTAEPDEPDWRGSQIIAPSTPALKLPLDVARRNRLDFALTHTDLITRGDRLRLRMVSDAHVIVQLLTGGQFSEADDSWIAVLGIASRVRLSYELGPWEFTVSARRKFGESDVRARFSYAIRF
jgi:hypothetical protein